jgi:dihydroflavonol-4-reductase
MKRVLVTGSTGFIGGALCKELVQRGYKVRAFHRSSSNLDLLKDLPVEHAIGDLSSTESLVAAMQDIDIVFHTAALLGPTTNPAEHYRVTVAGTRAVMDAAIENNVQRVVHTSSIAALGIPSFPSETNEPENAPILNEYSTWNLRPNHWAYGYGKYLAELEIQKAVAKGLDVVITNPSYVVGPGDIYRKDNSPFIQIANGKIPFIPTGGVNIVHVKDVVNGHLAAMEHGKRGERYILGGENLTFKAFIQLIGKISQTRVPDLSISGKLIRPLVNLAKLFDNAIKLPVPIDTIRFAGYGFYVSNQKSIVELHLKYQHTSEDAIRDAFAWFRQNPTD